jgi:hypothetical protein
VDRSQLTELHYIAPIANLASILQHGLLSHTRAARLSHDSVAMDAVQERRRRKVVPGGRPLHDYVNLYFCARHPMLFKRKSNHLDLCVLAVDLTVLDLPDTVITDQNAASGYARFLPSPRGLALLDHSLIFAEYWTDQNDPIAQMRKKRAKCAEVLVPDLVPSRYLLRAHVSCREAARTALEASGGQLKPHLNAHLFFR